MKSNGSKIIILIILLLGFNLVATKIYTRIDLTKDKRYTLSETTHTILKNLKEPTRI